MNKHGLKKKKLKLNVLLKEERQKEIISHYAVQQLENKIKGINKRIQGD